MEIKKASKPVYLIGSKEFLTIEEAETYKRSLEKRLEYTYYTVQCDPDLTEGRGYYGRFNVAIKKGYTRNALIHFLVTTYGNPIVKVMGVSPMDNWVYDEGQKYTTIEDLDAFLNKEVSVGVGDYRKTRSLVTVYLDEAGERITN